MNHKQLLRLAPNRQTLRLLFLHPTFQILQLKSRYHDFYKGHNVSLMSDFMPKLYHAINSYFLMRIRQVKMIIVKNFAQNFVII